MSIAIPQQNRAQDADSSSGSERIAWLDYAKGIAIILVVLGHVIRGLRPELVGGRIADYKIVDELIYSFHMPLFFFLSGFLFAKRLQADAYTFARALAIGLVVPYVIWSAIFVVLQYAALDGVNNRIGFDALLNIYRRPIGHMWFLYSLFGLNIAFYLSRRIAGAHGVFVLGAAFLAGYFAGWTYFPILSFMGGAFIGFGLLARRLSGRPPESRTLISFIAVLSAAVWAFMFYQSHHLQNAVLSQFATVFAAIGGVAMSVCVSLLIPQVGGFATRPLAQLGEASLAIFVCHTIFSAATRIFLSRMGITVPEIHLVAGTLVGLIIPTILFVVAARFRISPFVGFGNVPKSLYVSAGRKFD